MALPPSSLKQPAVENDRLASNLEDVAGSRDFACRADELDLHDVRSVDGNSDGANMADGVPGRHVRHDAVRSSSLGIDFSLEDDGEPLFVLRHHGRLPPTATSLVQEIREGVFVFTRMPR